MMMGGMMSVLGGQIPSSDSKACAVARCARILLQAGVVLSLLPACILAQTSYVARFTLEKKTYLVGEPIFCTFSIHNTGTQPFTFTYRNPTRIVNPELESEPSFSVVDSAGRHAEDPAPRRCGGAKGTAVYGSVTLPPGQIHTQPWLLNQWARFSRAGTYRIRAERRLPLYGVDASQPQFDGPPAAFASALNDLTLEIIPSNAEQLRAVFEPYEKVLRKPDARRFPEAVQAVITLPQPFLLDELILLATAPPKVGRWQRDQALEGLARLGTPPAWDAILKIAHGRGGIGGDSPQETASADALRGYAILLLAEKGDARFLSPILDMLARAPETMRGEILRALGYFRDSRANQALFEMLHSPQQDDRVNAILGLRNLGSKDVIPALIAALKDPEAPVRQVAHFALQNLTGQQFELSSTASVAESVGVEEQWRAWWRKQGPGFAPVRQAPCWDW